MQDSNFRCLKHFSKHFCTLTYSNSTNTHRKLRAVLTASLWGEFSKTHKKIFAASYLAEVQYWSWILLFLCVCFYVLKPVLSLLCASRDWTVQGQTIYIYTLDLACRPSPSERIKMNLTIASFQQTQQLFAHSGFLSCSLGVVHRCPHITSLWLLLQFQCILHYFSFKRCCLFFAMMLLIVPWQTSSQVNHQFTLVIVRSSTFTHGSL